MVIVQILHYSRLFLAVCDIGVQLLIPYAVLTLWEPKQGHLVKILYLSDYEMKISYSKLPILCFCFGILLPMIINSPSFAGGKTYSHTEAHCILWGVALGGKPAECRRRAITAVASTTTCRLKHHYKAKSGETWCVYKKQGFFGNDRKILISTKHCPRTYQCNRKGRWCNFYTTVRDL